MNNESSLYPIQNKFRFNQLLNGTWGFKTDPDSNGIQNNWETRLPDPEQMPVPGTFAELTVDEKRKYYTGDFWYQKDFFVPEFLKGQDIFIRFGSITHRATVFVNGHKVCFHEGGFLPFRADIINYVKLGETNHLAILVNNELSDITLPCGGEKVLSDGSKIAEPYFDFFNYSGIMRNVWLVATPHDRITNFDIHYEISSDLAKIKYNILASNKYTFRVTLSKNNQIVAQNISENKGELSVKQPHLWNLQDPYLYDFKIEMIQGSDVKDEYTNKIGIRTIKIAGENIFLNGQPVHLKGFGKHEDFSVLGKVVNESIIKRDFECMKWIGANCFRTSHYPYSEEWYQYADRYGFLIIDEVPAVGLNKLSFNFLANSNSKTINFFAQKTTSKLKEVHQKEIKEMIDRDKNHPSVIAWSLFNEPQSTTQQAYDYFKDIFDYTRKLDSQKRPCTGTLVMGSGPNNDKVHTLCDIVCLNRYYGWYMQGGPEIVDARESLIKELEAWQNLKLNKPFIFTEFGADTLTNLHRLPAEMWSPEYQDKYYQMYFDIFAKYPFVKGELVWNFADFKTTEGIMRVGGNDKGIFTRDREPKEVAYFLKKQWKKEESNYV